MSPACFQRADQQSNWSQRPTPRVPPAPHGPVTTNVTSHGVQSPNDDRKEVLRRHSRERIFRFQKQPRLTPKPRSGFFSSSLNRVPPRPPASDPKSRPVSKRMIEYHRQSETKGRTDTGILLQKKSNTRIGGVPVGGLSVSATRRYRIAN